MDFSKVEKQGGGVVRGDPAPRRALGKSGLHSRKVINLGGRRHLAIDIGSNGAIWWAPVGIRRQGGVKRFAVYTPEVAAI